MTIDTTLANEAWDQTLAALNGDGAVSIYERAFDGVVDDLDEDEYHAHPALGSTDVRRLLDSPARFRWLRDNPEEPSRAMDLGTIAHSLLLGVGQGYEVVDGNRNANAVKERIAEVEARGAIALKSAEAEVVRGMVAAVRAHPLAGPLLAAGTPERSLFWVDERTGVPCKARIDWTPANGLSMVDVKTSATADPAELPRHVAKFGYAVQDRLYRRGAIACGLATEETPFIFVFAEKERPHFVTVDRVRYDVARIDAAIDRALQRFRDCEESGIWPGYPQGLNIIDLPGWAYYDRETPDEY